MRILRFIVSFALVVILPGALLSLWHKINSPLMEQDATAPSFQQTESTNTEKTLRVLHEGDVITVGLEDYVCGVLAGEMPASFESEALKAQAVAIRTYTLRNAFGTGKHTNADLCTDAGCCQAYERISRIDDKDAVAKIEDAVGSTHGQVLTYMDELIDATYFSSSGGKTESAVAVWGVDVPYLQAIDSPGEDDTKYYRERVSFNQKEVLHTLGFPEDTNVFTYEDITYTDGNGVATVKICGKTFTGLELRRLLQLRSTSFEISKDGDVVTFITKGYGHRVGMSQYGAQAMAQQGSDYQQILAHYYPNTELITLNDSELNRLFDKERIL